MITGTTLLLIGIQLVVIAMLAMVWHKVRRIHLASYRTDELLTQTHQETHALYAQLAALSALERTLGMTAPLPAMRGWAGSPDFLLQAAQQLLRQRPVTIVECSSGVSTLVAARCCQLSGQGHVYSLEHESAYAEKTRAMLREYGLDSWATVVDAPLSQGADGLIWYQDRNLPAAAEHIDFLIIDGPPKEISELARYPAMPRLLDRMAENVTILLDDAGRIEEKTIIKRWLDENSNFSATDLMAEKGLTMLSRRT